MLVVSVPSSGQPGTTLAEYHCRQCALFCFICRYAKPMTTRRCLKFTREPAAAEWRAYAYGTHSTRNGRRPNARAYLMPAAATAGYSPAREVLHTSTAISEIYVPAHDSRC